MKSVLMENESIRWEGFVTDSKGVMDDDRGESTEEGIGRGESETGMRLTERRRQLAGYIESNIASNEDDVDG